MMHAVDLTTYLLLSGAVLMLLLSPGPNMAFVMTHGIAFGMRGGLAAAAGIGFADLVMTAQAA
jgi:threonine/homoserine/homoserine lactone efflux protein